MNDRSSGFCIFLLICTLDLLKNVNITCLSSAFDQNSQHFPNVVSAPIFSEFLGYFTNLMKEK